MQPAALWHTVSMLQLRMFAASRPLSRSVSAFRGTAGARSSCSCSNSRSLRAAPRSTESSLAGGMERALGIEPEGYLPCSRVESGTCITRAAIRGSCV